MRFLSLDELEPSMERDRSLIHMAAFRGAYSRRVIEIWRRRTGIFPDYVAVFAAEQGRLLGQVFVLRIPYTFPSGTEIISGIAAVATRPDRGRTGVARAIFEEVHRREREAGVRYAALWTNPSWAAHTLYEKLGYRDIYSSPWAVHFPVPHPRRAGRQARIRPGRRSDVAEIERLHADQSEGRLGFRPRPDGFLRVAVQAGEFDLKANLLVSRAEGRLEGYAVVDRDRSRTVCGELVARGISTRRTLMAAVGRVAGRTPFAFQHTFVTDFPNLFPRGEYSIVPRGWYVLMGVPLGRTMSSRAVVEEFATQDPRFLCLAGDRF